MCITFLLGFSNVYASASTVKEIKSQVWFAPPVYYERMYNIKPGVKPYDLMKLFVPGAPWAKARSHINVYKIYHWQILQNIGSKVGERDIRRMFAYLRAHHIALALEFGPLTISSEGGGGRKSDGNPTEAYQFSERAADIANAIKRLGGRLDYIAMDEPFCFGLRQWNSSGCQTSPVELAKNAVQSLRVFRSVFPSVQVGDIENIIGPEMLELMDGGNQGRWLNEYQQFVKAMATEGFPLRFFHGDVVWQTSWAVTAVKLKTMLNSEGVAFGIIFNSSELATSDALWMASAEVKINDYRALGISTDHQVFQSWNPYPSMVLPESAPYTFTHLVNTFYEPVPKSSPSLVKLYLLYNDRTKRHFYTVDQAEIAEAKREGAVVYVVMGNIYSSATAVPGLVPLHRLYNDRGKDHLYLISDRAVKAAKELGYRYENIQGYVFPPRSGRGLPVYGVIFGTECYLTSNPAEYATLKRGADLGLRFEVVPY